MLSAALKLKARETTNVDKVNDLNIMRRKTRALRYHMQIMAPMYERGEI